MVLWDEISRTATGSLTKSCVYKQREMLFYKESVIANTVGLLRPQMVILKLPRKEQSRVQGSVWRRWSQKPLVYTIQFDDNNTKCFSSQQYKTTLLHYWFRVTAHVKGQLSFSHTNSTCTRNYINNERTWTNHNDVINSNDIPVQLCQRK